MLRQAPPDCGALGSAATWRYLADLVVDEELLRAADKAAAAYLAAIGIELPPPPPAAAAVAAISTTAPARSSLRA